MKTRHAIWSAAIGWAVILSGPPAAPLRAQDADITETDPQAASALEAEFVTAARQLTFEGRRAGEGYFSRDGTKLVFQSEREAGNPFFQIYLMDLETGDVERVSPGTGKTTCAWIHPTGNHVLFASTHGDPQAQDKQKQELDERAAGTERRYAWDYDEHFELYQYDTQSRSYRNLTNTRGYDAEGSWSPDGSLIAFSSNRLAYSEPLDDRRRTMFEQDPSTMMDIYVMNADGSDVRRLTTEFGYDGGPFFSPDGARICWRRFSENGAIAEIMTMNVDGSDQKRLTNLGAMSWAPYYHPSGQYLIFTTNRHGFANFELYLVDASARREPVRVTHTAGFDGLPVFTPDGKGLAWTTNRTAAKQSQIFLAKWDHEAALKRLNLGAVTAHEPAGAQNAARESRARASVEFTAADVMRHVDYLCRRELAGRGTGTPGEHLATAYVAAYMDSLGLVPAGDDGGWYQSFEFTAGVSLGDNNRLARGTKRYEIDKAWRPLAFSNSGPVDEAGIVFAGYGIAAPAAESHEEYDSFVHLDVRDQWVLVFRDLPDGISAERRQHLSRFANLRYKAMLARDRGARGLIVVSGPNSKFRSRLVPLGFDGSMSGTSIPVISVSDTLAGEWLAAAGKQIKALQDKLDTGAVMMGFALEDVRLSAEIDVRQVRRTGRNVLGRLPAGKIPTEQVVVIGAHVDHLGTGPSSSSLARDEEREGIHFGADDNASGVAATLEVAEYLADLKGQGKLAMKRDLVFAAWSGEELGLIGSNHFVKTYGQPPQGHNTGHGEVSHPAAHGADGASLHPQIAACLNMDMVGRLDQKLVLQGVGSSTFWRGEIERRNVPVGLSITLQEDSYLPTDASSFFMKGVPILSAFTGSHAEYHTPRDTPDTLNYDGAAQVARLMGLVARSLATRDDPPDYVAQAAPAEGERRASLRAYLGTVPDYVEELKGVKLSGVAKNGPADKAGVKGGDVIVELAGRKIENIYDYTYAIEALKVGEKVRIVVQRTNDRLTFEVTPTSRD